MDAIKNNVDNKKFFIPKASLGDGKNAE